LELQLQPTTTVEIVSSEPTQSYTVVAVDPQQQTCCALAIGPGRSSSNRMRLEPGAYTLRVFDGQDQLLRSVPITVGNIPIRVQVP
jgi:hypothetical protein